MSGMKAVLRNASVLTDEELKGVAAGTVFMRDLATKYGKKPHTIRNWLRVRGVCDFPLNVYGQTVKALAAERRRKIVAMAERLGAVEAARRLGISRQRVYELIQIERSQK